MDEKRTVYMYDSIRLSQVFLGTSGARACNVYQALLLLLLKGLGMR
jgi:hypothetical protein